MKILFDQGTPNPLRRSLAEHEVDMVFEKGWDQLKNGDLLAVAILNGYEVLVSTDQSLRHQHDIRRIRPGHRDLDDDVVAADQSQNPSRRSSRSRCNGRQPDRSTF